MANDASIRIMAEPLDPETCRFVVDRPVWPDGSFHFGGPGASHGSPLADALFAIPGILDVLVQDEKVTVRSDGLKDWREIGPAIGRALREVLAGGEPAVSAAAVAELPAPTAIRDRVERLIQEKVNPSVASHGGWIELIDVRSNEVFLRMGGGCQGCGSAAATLKLGVERLIRDEVPEVGAILDTTDHAAGRNPYYAR